MPDEYNPLKCEEEWITMIHDAGERKPDSEEIYLNSQLFRASRQPIGTVAAIVSRNGVINGHLRGVYEIVEADGRKVWRNTNRREVFC